MSLADGPSLCKICGKARATAFPPAPLLSDLLQLAEIHSLLRSNSLPTNLSPFQNLIVNALPELARYDAEIARIKEVLGGLVSQRDALAARITGCRSILAPIRRLPPELLVEILDFCAPPSALQLGPTDTLVDELDRRGPRHLLRLSQVCSYWRVVVKSSARLWSCVVVDLDFWEESLMSSGMLMNSLDSALNNGGNYPLALRAGLDRDHPERRRVLELLIKHAHRWRDIHLWINLERERDILAVAKGNLPLLENLHVDYSLGPGAADLDIFEVAPRLTKVMFRGDVSGIPILPWPQLKSFSYALEADWLTDLTGPLSLMSSPFSRHGISPGSTHRRTRALDSFTFNCVARIDPRHRACR
ncbi:F-box domain-containing protein [Mycena venus]|uniref:F-box domain-containing protein n=1 Tax=Mycena venus TaxID=2733690 RepID=A0A8H7D7T2_9AGAR|nr:F-box domain-containing protein [Mycena venus]